jgi:hypothetical protein
MAAQPLRRSASKKSSDKQIETLLEDANIPGEMVEKKFGEKQKCL